MQRIEQVKNQARESNGQVFRYAKSRKVATMDEQLLITSTKLIDNSSNCV
jgi:hypothetical protein